jgi:hypothetical protein
LAASEASSETILTADSFTTPNLNSGIQTNESSKHPFWCSTFRHDLRLDGLPQQA